MQQQNDQEKTKKAKMSWTPRRVVLVHGAHGCVGFFEVFTKMKACPIQALRALSPAPHPGTAQS